MNVQSWKFQRKSACFAVFLWGCLILADLPALGASESATGAIQSASGSAEDPTLEKAKELLGKKQTTEAKKLLQDFIVKKSNRPVPPYVEKGVLYIYTSGPAEILFFTSLDKDPSKKNLDALQKYYPWYDELQKKSPWGNIIFENPDLPRAYYYMAYAAIEERKFKQALSFLQKSLDLWPYLSESYCETVYLCIALKDYPKAKETANLALEKYLDFDKANKATMYRHLGYIAVEEKKLDEAEKYYQECLKIIPDEPKALAELEYIKQLRNPDSTQPKTESQSKN